MQLVICICKYICTLLKQYNRLINTVIIVNVTKIAQVLMEIHNRATNYAISAYIKHSITSLNLLTYRFCKKYQTFSRYYYIDISCL